MIIWGVYEHVAARITDVKQALVAAPPPACCAEVVCFDLFCQGAALQTEHEILESPS